MNKRLDNTLIIYESFQKRCANEIEFKKKTLFIVTGKNQPFLNCGPCDSVKETFFLGTMTTGSNVAQNVCLFALSRVLKREMDETGVEICQRDPEVQ